MLQQIFTIYDSKAGAYLPPFFLPQRGMALRTFGDCINDDTHQFSKHPEDYTLMSLGTFDDQSALAITTAPESIGNGLEFVVKEGNMPGWDDMTEEQQNAELKGFAKDRGESPEKFVSKKGNRK